MGRQRGEINATMVHSVVVTLLSGCQNDSFLSNDEACFCI